MNVGPLTRVYPPLNTPDTNRALTSYLVSRIKKEIMDRGLFGPMTQNMDKVKIVFGEIGDPSPEFYDALSPNFSDEKIIYTEDLNDSEMIDEVIKQSYFLILRRLASGATANFFEGVYGERYNDAAMDLARSMVAHGTDEQRVIMEPIVIPVLGQGANGGLVNTRSAEGNAWVAKHSLYQLPGPLLLAMQYILFDYVVRPMERYPKFKFESESRIAFADDQVLASINPTYLSMMKFSAKFKLFPITVRGETFYYLEDLEERAREELQECLSANQLASASAAALTRAEAEFDRVVTPLSREYASINLELETLKTQAAAALNGGYAIVSELLRDNGPAEAGWSDYVASPNLIRTFANLASSAFEDGDAANTNGNITFIQAWWNWAKRTYTGDVWTKEYFLSGNPSLGHGVFLGADFNNVGMRNWLAQARDASARWESAATKAKIKELHDVIVATDDIHKQAYQRHWELFADLERAKASSPSVAPFQTADNDARSAATAECQESAIFVSTTNSVRISLNLPPINWEE